MAYKVPEPLSVCRQYPLYPGHAASPTQQYSPNTTTSPPQQNNYLGNVGAVFEIGTEDKCPCLTKMVINVLYQDGFKLLLVFC